MLAFFGELNLFSGKAEILKDKGLDSLTLLYPKNNDIALELFYLGASNNIVK